MLHLQLLHGQKKNSIILISLYCFIASGVFAQQQRVADSLARIYKMDTTTGIAKLDLLLNLSFNEVANYQQAINYAEELARLSKQAGDDQYLSAGYSLKGTKERILGNLDEALGAFFKSAEICKRSHHVASEGNAYGEIGNTYSAAKNHPNAMLYYNKAIETLKLSGDSNSLASAMSNVGDEFVKNKSFDSALQYFIEAKKIFDKRGDADRRGYTLGNLGVVYANIGENDFAEKNINEAISIFEEAGDYYPICDYLLTIADVYANKKDIQAALNYTLQSLSLAEQYKLKEQTTNAEHKASEIYEKMGNTGESLKHYKNYITYRDSLTNLKSVQDMYNLQTRFNDSQHEAQLKLLSQQERNQRNLLIYLMIIFGLTVIILGVILRNNRSKQRAYTVLNEQKQETDKAKTKAEDALKELRITQTQLVHRERMASLGELTAGIAHEIQNPLNFVNNFSDVNAELLEELQQELQNGNVDEALSISNGIRENEQKINHHGKRADAIVKGMMQHSRTSTGEKQLTDINTLASEYLKLSYHGLRAKDKNFNAVMETHFDEHLPKINVVSQDVGRLLLNLYNNAFYAIAEKARHGVTSYKPTVSVTTKKATDNVKIIVRDNGTGIPQQIIDKIFNPFFTTKPTGQGTGLGLSLSYDIIRGHGGTISADSKEGEFTEFIIQLPVEALE